MGVYLTCVKEPLACLGLEKAMDFMNWRYRQL